MVDPALRLLKDLVAINSVNPTLVSGAPGEAEIADAVANENATHRSRRRVLHQLEALDRTLQARPPHPLLGIGSLHASTIAGGREVQGHSEAPAGGEHTTRAPESQRSRSASSSASER
jgi:hypothetical protein